MECHICGKHIAGDSYYKVGRSGPSAEAPFDEMVFLCDGPVIAPFRLSPNPSFREQEKIIELSLCAQLWKAQKAHAERSIIIRREKDK
jgi:hypothetical protein